MNTITPITEIANCSADGADEHVDQARDHDADQAHEQERAHLGQVGLGRVAVEAGIAPNMPAVMKNTRAMLAPVNTRKIDAIDRPMTAQNAQKVICAVPRRHGLDPEREEEHEGQRRQHHHPLQRRAEDRHVRRPGWMPLAVTKATMPVSPDRSSCSCRPQHVPAQAFVELGLIDRAAGGRVPIEQSVCHVILDPKGSFTWIKILGRSSGNSMEIERREGPVFHT